ncbi:4-hydroxyphenylacetate isomerase [Marinomonas rhizomae]|uniref:5-carboxy-2-oxohept-3-enedioate decarboxylase HpaG1 subunit n=1 Tax=Marinomonas rhizomae TaxID=491948 RepID=A0A366J0L8_9GAMM|nr:fumarylacetoacetate hydrolase family protein [Marinomonas rhizomae]RBP80492.1 5-carboxy-2-oxohept-3-enedioate decarboxylase HpaG1 subunit [Marinomonas rhizomae]RNF71729.1 4-hydroxyphenylacetate isomerase [Marinomonas rhizomae]
MLYYKTRKNDQVINLQAQAAFEVPLENNLLPAVNGAVIGVALNDKTLYQSLEKQFNEKPHVSPPKTPVLHIKTDNTHIGYGDTIQIPSNLGSVFAGPSLGIVIGKKACRVTEESALDYVQGYTIVNEVSLAETSFYRPAVKAKCRDTFCPIGPWVVDATDVETPQNLTIKTYINDTLCHETSTNQMIHSIEQVIAYISSFITLDVGDMIIAGTPLRTESLEIKANDVVMVEIEKIGRLVNPVAAE